MAKDQKTYYWCRKNANFGKSIKFGDPMPTDIDSETLKNCVNNGWVSESKPASFEAAKIEELKNVREDRERLLTENSVLKNKVDSLKKENKEAKELIEKAGNSENLLEENELLKEKISELDAELEDMPKNVRAANQEIKKLRAELDELTKPESKGAKK